MYHPVFLDQTLRLLRAQCAYCHRFRLTPKEIGRYTCKLRLLQHGLLAEAAYVDTISEGHPGLAVSEDDSDPDDPDSAKAVDGVTSARNAYVLQALQKLQTTSRNIRMSKHEGSSEMRRTVVRAFMQDIAKGRRECTHCKGISPSYRKDLFVKIFEKALPAREQAKMASGHFKLRDAVSLRQQGAKLAGPGSLREERDQNTGLSSDEDMGEDDDGPADELDERGEVTKRRPSAKAQPPTQRYISAQEVLERLRLLFYHEQEILSLIYMSRPPKKAQLLTPDMFFVQTLLVPPNRYRPEARTGDAQVTEAQQNSLYKLILGACFRLAHVHREMANGDDAGDMTSLHEAWTNLQDCVNSLIDQTKNPVQGAAAKRNEEGIKQKLEKKEGLFRKNMMGKRVNYAARSVISPDPNIETNEIGVPPVFARKLTYPEPVTSHNFKEMQKAVINGVGKWPGASAIENENGQIVNLRNKSLEDRVSLANQLLAPTSSNFSGTRNKKVYRHLSNGDVVLMNRQPTLHKPSIMGHRVRVLPGEKTIRMHYANCNTYNADFDGDEMNMHFPQNEIARAEALQLADTDHQYISGTQGEPLRGLIQDHLSVSVSLCSKDTFFTRDAYHQLIYSALRPESGHTYGERIELVPPAILKPAARWTGKQVITTLLKNIKPPNRGLLWMSGKSQIPASRWETHVEEGETVFRDGELISGILDKSQLGPKSGGFVHSVHEVYGAPAAGRLLSSLGRMLTRFLSMRAFSCGMEDLRLTPSGEAHRQSALSAAPGVGRCVAAGYVSLEDSGREHSDVRLRRRLEDVMRTDAEQEGLDRQMTKAGSQISNDVALGCLPDGLQKPFPANQMQTMTVSGAKGGLVNATLISCNLGQQVLEGRRVPLMVSGKSLPCYAPFETDIRAGGYVVSRFLTGIRPQEYYFHHMAGRVGLIDTAVKTSRSGYLQRCIVKGMEGLEVAYDTSVRDSDGTLVQFLYGEDGLEVAKQRFLTNFRFQLYNLDSQLDYISFSDPGTDRLFQHREELIKRSKRAIKKAKANPACADEPVNCLFNPAQHAFAMSERFFAAMSDYISQNEDGLIKGKSENRPKPLSGRCVSKKAAEKVFAAKHFRSMVEPGEAVGIVAGQSVGEPSTQMTLNTFHLAGHAAQNVTQGIPRLREILMTASVNIATPTMTLVLRPEAPLDEAETLARSISVLPLPHVLDSVTVRERVGRGTMYPIARMYEISLHFFDEDEYATAYRVSASHVLDTVERKLLPTLVALVKKEVERMSRDGGVPVSDIGSKAGTVEVARTRGGPVGGTDNDNDDDDDGDGGGDDEDATGAKMRANRTEAVSYGPNDDDDDALQKRMEREGESEDDDDAGHGSGEDPSPTPVAAKVLEPRPSDSDGEGDREPDGDSAARETRLRAEISDLTTFRSDMQGSSCSFTLEYDVDAPKLLMLSLVQDALRKSLIRHVKGLGTCTLEAAAHVRDGRTGDAAAVPAVQTEGANVRAMQGRSDLIDDNRIATNDIAAVLEIYGVEACRANIARELRNVFSSHGIGVDGRHLNLIADYMTRNGGFAPFNRNGLKGNVSPFTKMSFETTVGFLKDAVLDGDWDDLTTPSSRLVVGRLGRTGTGFFDVLTQAPTRHYDGLRA